MDDVVIRKLTLLLRMKITVIVLVAASLAILGLLYKDRAVTTVDNPDLTVVHITDTHLMTHGSVTNTPWTHKISLFGYRLHRPCTGLAESYLQKAVAEINNKIKPDVVVMTGDIVNYGDDIAALHAAASALQALRCPIIVVQGDHDLPHKEESKECWQTLFGELEGCSMISDNPFFYLPFGKKAANIANFSTLIKERAVRESTQFLCLHRMLRAPVLLDRLARRFHGCSVLDPYHKEIVQVLEQTDMPWIVLCGHSHTGSIRKWGEVIQICTPSLAEYPHAFRVIEIKNKQLFTQLVSLHGV